MTIPARSLRRLRACARGFARALLLTGGLAATLGAQAMTVVSPANTGIPGEEVRVVAHAPDGTIWVGARWPFWGTGGIGVFDPVSREWSGWSTIDSWFPTPFVNDIEFQDDGVAWVATGAGLIRLDPATGDHDLWDSSNSPMTLDVVANLSLAPDGTVWFNSSSSQSAGDAIYSFDGDAAWRRYAVPDQIPFAAPWTDLQNVFVDSSGVVWVANGTLNGLARFDGRAWTLVGANVDRFDDMAEDQFGNLWVGTNLVGSGFAFYRYDGQQFTSYALGSMTKLVSDPDTGAIYVGNWHGTVLRSSDGGQSFQTYLSGLNKVFGIAPDPASDDVWIGTPGAVGHFLHSGAWVEDFNTWNTGFPDHFVDDFQVDASGNLWIATGEAGLTRFDGRRWRNFGDHNVGSEPYPFAGNEPMGAAFEDSQGRHWLGGNGIARWDSETNTITGFWNWQNNPGMGVTMFPWFAEDAAGEVYACSEPGAIFRFDETSQLWVLDPFHPYSGGHIPGFAADSTGTVWVAGWFTPYHLEDGAWVALPLPHADYFFDLGGISAFAIAPDDTLWFGTIEGVVHWDGSQFQHYDSSNSPLPADRVFGLDVRADGLLGLTARGGGVGEPSSIDLVDGPFDDPASWTTWLYGSSPIPHWQLGRCRFDPWGDLWTSTISEGTAVVHCGAWADLGQGLAGAFGAPYLKGFGVPAAGGSLGLELARGLGAAAASYVLGVSALDAPFKGGTLVPAPAVIVPVTTDTDGDTLVEFPWPAGVAGGWSLYSQVWVSDPAGPLGFSASNAVRLDVP